jgi:hypothetical protein
MLTLVTGSAGAGAANATPPQRFYSNIEGGGYLYGNDVDYFLLKENQRRRFAIRATYREEFNIQVEYNTAWVMVSRLGPGNHFVSLLWRGSPAFNVIQHGSVSYAKSSSDMDIAMILQNLQKIASELV